MGMFAGRLRISTLQELDKWLEENCWFEDGHVLSLWPEPSPAGHRSPCGVRLQLAHQVAGGWEAGGTRILRVFGVEANGVREWSISTPESYQPDHCMEGIERIETLIRQLRKKYTILIVTHNMAQARRASDECIFMLLGRTVEHDKTLAIFHTPREKETEMYITGRYG